ncbi:hypothetical protein [Haloferula sp. A504]|uniref:hypothetical protein n=1 Tax=Haloferula sp. A504 TaxID=3373601 RepID=UPI0031C71978|nr:hypothetical protein [Verrucomicrobiaceae bacterium E54]
MNTIRPFHPALCPLAAIVFITPVHLFGETAAVGSVDRILGEQQINGPGVGYYPDNTAGVVGISGSTATSSRIDTNVVLGFTLPPLPTGATVETVILSFEITGAQDLPGSGLPNLHAYLLDTTDPDGSGTTYFHHGPEDGTPTVPFVGATRVEVSGTSQNTFDDDTEDWTLVLTGDALTLFQSFYGGDNLPDRAEAFFRFNLDVNPDETVGSQLIRYNLDMALDEAEVEINVPLITYVDAAEGSGGNTFATGSTLEDTSWMVVDVSATDDDQWSKRTTVEGNGDTLFQGMPNGSPDLIPELTTEITGLADGTYDIYVFYWDQVDSDTQNWVLSAGLTSGALTTYSSPFEPEVIDATTENVTNAANLPFTGPVTVRAGGGLRSLFGIKVGQATVSGGSPVAVHVDMNLDGNSSTTRAWYDGVGYAPAAAAAGSSPVITSFSAVEGGVWELTLMGAANTDFEFRSSTTLDFTPGILVENLTQDDPGDPGMIGGTNDSVVTTDGNGLATVRMALTGNPADFVRAQSVP